MEKLNLKQFKIKLSPDSKAIQGLQAGDVIRRQYVDNNEGIYSLMIVTDNDKDEVLVKQKYVDVYWFSAILVDGDEPKQGQLLDFVRVGNLYNPDRTGALYLTASDSKAPYMDVIDGIGVENSLYHPTEDGLDAHNSYQHKESGNVLVKFLKAYQSQNNALNFTKTDNAGCSAEISKTLHIQDTQRVIVSFAAKSNRENSIVVNAGDERDEVLVTTDWKFNVLVFNNETDGNYTFSLKLANALKSSGDEVVISDLNITTLAAISTFIDANKGRIGKIDGISDTIFGSLDGYGAYFQKFYATKDVAIAGTLTAGDKNGFGSTFYVGKIHKNCLINSLYGNFIEKIAPSQTLPITGVGDAFDLTDKITINAQTKEWAEEHGNKDYCFSLWLKGEGEVFVEYLGEKVARFEVNEFWNRYDCVLKIHPNYPVHVVLNGAGVFCSPQLEEGKNPSPYQPTDVNLNYTDEYGAWFSRGGIGGTIQNPLLKLNEDGSIESGKGNFKIHANGNAEFEGKVTANEGNIAGWEIQKNKLAKNGLEINSDGHISGSENGEVKWKVGNLEGTNTKEFGELNGSGAYIQNFYGAGDFFLVSEGKKLSQLIGDRADRLVSPNFVTGALGKGFSIDKDKSGKYVLEIDKIYGRDSLLVPSISFNNLDIVQAESADAMGFGVIKDVDTEKQIASIELLEGEYGNLCLEDICRGTFYALEGAYKINTRDKNGFDNMAGYATSYFTPTQIIENKAGSFKFKYEIQPYTSIHPVKGMKFYSYGNFSDASRQNITYRNRFYTRRLKNMNTWNIDPERNIAYQNGLLDGLNIGGVEMKGYGQYSENNYFTGIDVQFTPQQLSQLKGKDAYSVSLTKEQLVIHAAPEDTALTDHKCYNVTTQNKNVTSGGENVITSINTLSSRIQAFKGDEQLFYSDTVKSGAYIATVKAEGCDAEIKAGTVVVTNVQSDNAEVKITINCEGYAVFEKEMEVIVVRDGKKAKPAKISKDNTWLLWDAEKEKYIDSGFSVIGDDGHSPYIKNNTWWEWDAKLKAYHDTGIVAKGKDGKNGQNGQNGKDGKDAQPPKISGRKTWLLWDAEKEEYIDSNFSVIGDDGHSPYIKDNIWWEWDAKKGEYHSTGIVARGKDANPPKISDRKTWLLWDTIKEEYVDSGFSVIGDDGHSPYIYENTWWEWDAERGAYHDTGIIARGRDANPPKISDNKTWLLWDAEREEYIDSGLSVVGDDGHSPFIFKDTWWEWSAQWEKYQDTGIVAIGKDGKDAQPPKISSERTWLLWDAEAGYYVDSGFSVMGDDGHSPYIKNGTWWEWDSEAEKYHDTGIVAKGKDGKDGKNGKDGKDGKNGKDANPPKISEKRTWLLWDATKERYVDSGFSVVGDDGHSPYIVDNTWWEWSKEMGRYHDTGIVARGKDGKDGRDGKDGKDAENPPLMIPPLPFNTQVSYFGNKEMVSVVYDEQTKIYYKAKRDMKAGNVPPLNNSDYWQPISSRQELGIHTAFINMLLANDGFVNNLITKKLLVKDDSGNIMAKFNALNKTAQIGEFEVVGGKLTAGEEKGESPFMSLSKNLVLFHELTSQYASSVRLGANSSWFEDVNAFLEYGSLPMVSPLVVTTQCLSSLDSSTEFVGIAIDISGRNETSNLAAIKVKGGKYQGFRRPVRVTDKITKYDTHIIADSNRNIMLPEVVEIGQEYIVYAKDYAPVLRSSSSSGKINGEYRNTYQCRAHGIYQVVCVGENMSNHWSIIEIGTERGTEVIVSDTTLKTAAKLIFVDQNNVNLYLPSSAEDGETYVIRNRRGCSYTVHGKILKTDFNPTDKDQTDRVYEIRYVYIAKREFWAMSVSNAS